MTPDIIPNPLMVPNNPPVTGWFTNIAHAGMSARPAKVAHERQRSSRELLVRRCFPEVLLTTHEGRRVQLYDDLIKGKIVLINFMYTSCQEACPRITQNLVKVQKLLGSRMGRDVFMYSLTLDPARDTPQALKKYAKAHQVGAGWFFLTGAAEDLELLRRRLGFTNLNPVLDQNRDSHVGNVRYGNEGRQLWSACPGTSHPEFIVKAISWIDWPAQTSERGLQWSGLPHGLRQPA